MLIVHYIREREASDCIVEDGLKPEPQARALIIRGNASSFQYKLKRIDMDEEEATLDSQFVSFTKLFDSKRDGTTITLYRSDYWMRQSKILDDRKLTMTDTGLAWWKYCKTELNFAEWYEFLTDVCTTKNLNQEFVETAMTNCGLPGSSAVIVPQYRDFFNTYKPKEKIIGF